MAYFEKYIEAHPDEEQNAFTFTMNVDRETAEGVFKKALEENKKIVFVDLDDADEILDFFRYELK